MSAVTDHNDTSICGSHTNNVLSSEVFAFISLELYMDASRCLFHSYQS